MEVKLQYSIHTDIKYKPLELEEIGALADSCKECWWNQSLSLVNDCVVRLGVFDGEFHWHKHDTEDEFFYTIEGKLILDFEGQTVELYPRQGIMVPRGILHRTRAPKRTVVLMIEAATVKPTGD
jgi:mannose-6-phosphate isomerase-like protein (cupin superfamily)